MATRRVGVGLAAYGAGRGADAAHGRGARAGRGPGVVGAYGDIELARWNTATGTPRTVTTFDGGDYPLGVRPFLLKENEGHGFVNPENIIDVYRAADRFLARHLG